jgi:hypothetical protein
MRNRVVLIKGFANISPRITLAAFERINADHVVIMAALRFPQLIPEHLYGFQMDLQRLDANLENLLKFWEIEGQQHILAAEYANVVIDRGGDDVRAVEGITLRTDWYYQTIRNYHRHFGQMVVDCEIFKDYVEMDESKCSIDEAITRLMPHPSLG